MEESKPPPGSAAPSLIAFHSSHKTEGTFEASLASTVNSGFDYQEKNDLEQQQPESIAASNPPPVRGTRLIFLTIGYVPSYVHIFFFWLHIAFHVILDLIPFLSIL